MELSEIIASAWRRFFPRGKSAEKKETNRDRIRNLLVEQVEYSTALARFICHAHNHGHAVRLTIQVDGQDCGVSVYAHPKEALVEYLAQWACAEKLKKHARLEEFDKGGEEK